MPDFLKKKKPLLQILQEKKLFLTKNRGQNFLVDSNIRDKITQFIPNHSPAIVEIGAGLGHWTYFLQQKTSQLVAIEIDRGFVSILQENFPNVQVIHQDFLNFSLSQIFEFPIEDYIICGNIPYLISTKICEHILNFPILPTSIFLTVEKEYALEKILDDNSPLNQKFQYFYDIQLLQKIPNTCFFPIPNKDSVFIGMKQRKIKISEDNYYLDFVDQIFRQTKKTIYNNLSNYNLPETFWNKDYLIKMKKLRVHQITTEDLIFLFQEIKAFDKGVFQK